MTLTPKTWIDAHYILATGLTIEAAIRWWIDKHIDLATGTFVIGFWGTAIGNSRLNNGVSHDIPAVQNVQANVLDR